MDVVINIALSTLCMIIIGGLIMKIMKPENIEPDGFVKEKSRFEQFVKYSHERMQRRAVAYLIVGSLFLVVYTILFFTGNLFK